MPPNVATDPFSRLAAIGQRNAVAKSALLKFWSTGFLALATTIGMAFGVEANDAKIHELKPFGDEPISLPGRLEAENYDRGGEGIAFYDNEPLNLGNGKGNLLFDDPQSTFRRDEGVDLSYTKGPRDRFEGDRNLAGRLVAPDSLYLGWVMPGEWIRYTVRVKEAGLYRVSGHVSAKNENSAPRIHFSGNDAETQLTIPHTESAHRWTLAKSLGEVELVAGVQALTLHIGDVRGFNIDWLEFKPVGSMSPKKTVAIESVDFNRHIRPILADNCFECHGPDEHSRKADLRLDTAQGAYEYAIVPGKPDESLLVELMLTHDKSERMPPPKSPRQPTPEQINKIIQWIEEGAPYDEHWAFVPPVRRDLPPVSDAAWPRQPLDAFVLAHLDEKGLAPQPEAAPGVLARRLSLALTGLPAMPEQLRAFEDAYDADPESAISDWTDELLASPG
ncbi:MAG: c-type cytochrome domain-containing protein, partial [Verrucomicrobiota bacterium]